MDQVKIILERLKNPKVIISVVSQIVGILVLLNFDVDTEWIFGIVTAVTSVLAMLGIVTNPDTQNHGYGDDLYFCPTCNRKTAHVKANGNMLCPECGTINDSIIILPE
ncbi:MAG: hypothetical protein R3Y24_04820 [Eubacteriales bacterium]